MMSHNLQPDQVHGKIDDLLGTNDQAFFGLELRDQVFEIELKCDLEAEDVTMIVYTAAADMLIFNVDEQGMIVGEGGQPINGYQYLGALRPSDFLSKFPGELAEAALKKAREENVSSEGQISRSEEITELFFPKAVAAVRWAREEGVIDSYLEQRLLAHPLVAEAFESLVADGTVGRLADGQGMQDGGDLNGPILKVLYPRVAAGLRAYPQRSEIDRANMRTCVAEIDVPALIKHVQREGYLDGQAALLLIERDFYYSVLAQRGKPSA